MSDAFYALSEIRQRFSGPEMIFADNPRALFAFGVKVRTHGTYSHFAWRIGPNRVADQRWTFREVPLDRFKGYHLKFVSSPLWTDLDKVNLTIAILSDLSLPWYSNLYDVPGVVGKLVGVNLEFPKLFFCSERGHYLRLVDRDYNLRSPTPTDLNLYTKGSGKYAVTARYSPD